MDYFEQDIPKYRKKSKNKGRSRANHKHEYIDVALYQPSSYTPGKEVVSKARVCTVCGRIASENFGWMLDSFTSNKSSEKEEFCATHEHWYRKRYLDKNAYRKTDF